MKVRMSGVQLRHRALLIVTLISSFSLIGVSREKQEKVSKSSGQQEVSVLEEVLPLTEAKSIRGNQEVRNQILLDRVPLPKEKQLVQPKFPHRLIVKFKDELLARAVDGTVLTLNGRAELFDKEFQKFGPVKFEQLIQLPQETLAQLESRALDFSGTGQPDLASMMIVGAPQESLIEVADLLNGSELVEWVQFEILYPEPPVLRQDPCTDITPVTPNYTANQGYRGPNPGLNMDAMWARGNGRGAGIKIADCEYWFDPQHEDLCGVITEPGQTPDPGIVANGWHEHGTAVLGEMVGIDNNYGVRGLAPNAQAYFFSEWTVQRGYNRVQAIANAVAAMSAGDIILLEMQAQGATGFGPAELSNAVWTVSRNATDAGIIVVGAAGNGNQNLDGPEYQAYRNLGDSGAIIVGAGSNTVAHSKLNFSTYGSRVNVQGWGQSVFTLGYGSFATLGGDSRQKYTSGFSGTSSASPFIAAACASLQSYAVAELGRRLTPAEMRQILMTTGWAQGGGGGNIGRFPNLVEAADKVLELRNVNISSFQLVVAGKVTGGLAELQTANEQRLCISADIAQRQGQPAANIRQIEVLGTLPSTTPTQLKFVIEGYTDGVAATQKVELFNFQSNQFEVIDTRNSAVNQDQRFEISATGNLSRFAHPTSRQTRARVAHTFSLKQKSSLRSCIDYIGWIFVD